MSRMLFEFIFGCRHKHYTFPIRRDKIGNEHYVCCVDCGREMAYDWQQMKVVSSAPYLGEIAS